MITLDFKWDKVPEVGLLYVPISGQGQICNVAFETLAEVATHFWIKEDEDSTIKVMTLEEFAKTQKGGNPFIALNIAYNKSLLALGAPKRGP